MTRLELVDFTTKRFICLKLDKKEEQCYNKNITIQGDSMKKGSIFLIFLMFLLLLVSCGSETYTIELDANGGMLQSDVIEVSDNGYYALPTPYKAGYIFEGWYSGTDRVESTGYWSLGKSVQLKARWKYGEYNIIYNLSGGIGAQDNPNTYTYDTEDFSIIPPTKDGEIFSHWVDQRGNIYVADAIIKKGSEGDLNLTAVWWNYVDENGVKYRKNGENLEVVEYLGKSSTGFSIPSDCYGIAVTSIADSAFKGLGTKTLANDSFFRVEIPESITKIGNNAFDDCVDVKVLLVPYDIESVSNGQQYKAVINKWLEKVEIGEGNTDLVEVIKQERIAIGNSIIDKTN